MAEKHPPGTRQPDLGPLATRILARNALSALRGPKSRGAVPTLTLAKNLDQPLTTTSRWVRRSAGSTDAVPFDLAVSEAFSSDRNGLRERWEIALAIFVEARGAVGIDSDEHLAEQAVKPMLMGAFSGSLAQTDRDFMLVAFLLYAAALCCDRSAEVDETTRAAEVILELRAKSYDQSTALYVSGLKFLLSVARRRPKDCYCVEDIVTFLHSAFDGYVIRHLHDPDRYPLAMLVNAMWDASLSMTEPGFLASDDAADRSRDVLIERALWHSEHGNELPPVEDIAVQTAVDPSTALAMFPIQSALANAALDHLFAGMRDLDVIANETSRQALQQLRGFLGWIGEVVDTYTTLVEAAIDAPVWHELRWLIELMLVSAEGGLDAAGREMTANQLLVAARQGTTGRIAWEMVLGQVELHARLPE